MRKRAICLLRVSSEAQAGPDRQGLPAQRRLAERIADSHGLEIIDEVSIQVSGARVLDDPQFCELLDRIEDPAICGVIVADLDRLMRPEDPGYYSIFRHFRDSNTILYTSAGAKDYRTDRLLMMLEAEIAALERERIAERTRRGREEKRREGKRAEGLVGMPRGVSFDPKIGNWSYVFPEAERVREAFRLWVASDGSLSFAEIGRRAGIQARNGSWAVRGLLRQPLYMGIYRVDRRWKDGKPTPREPHEVHEHQVIDPPLVPPEEWQRAQELIARRLPSRPPRRNPDEQDGIYSGFLDCAECGARLWMHPGNNRGAAAYICPNAGRGGQCGTGHTSHRLADPQIDEGLEWRLGDIGTLTRLIEEAAQEAERRAAGSVKDLTRRLTQIANQRRRVKDAYVEGMFELPELKKRLATLDAEASQIEELMAGGDGPIEVSPDVVSALVDVFASWSDLGRDDKRSILRDFQIRVRVKRPQKRVLAVESVRIGVVRDNFTIYKKMKRLGIE